MEREKLYIIFSSSLFIHTQNFFIASFLKNFMKRGLIILLLISILFLQLVSAETTFFEGDLGYRDDFIMAPVPEEGIIEEPIIKEPEVESFISGGGFLVRQEGIAETIPCPLMFESLKEHINKKRSIEYTKKELEILTFEINQELGENLSTNQISYIIDNFEDTCNSPLPLLSGSAIGRFRNLLNPFILIVSFIVLVFISYIGYKIISVLKKRKRKK